MSQNFWTNGVSNGRNLRIFVTRWNHGVAPTRRVDPIIAAPRGSARFSTLYRAACADLALADAYQLPPGTVTYLHRLVARAHNQLYRANKFEPSRWTDVVFREAPQQIFADPCVRVSALIFFGLFALSMYLGRNEDLFPGFAEAMVGSAAARANGGHVRETTFRFTRSLCHHVRLLHHAQHRHRTAMFCLRNLDHSLPVQSRLQRGYSRYRVWVHGATRCGRRRQLLSLRHRARTVRADGDCPGRGGGFTDGRRIV